MQGIFNRNRKLFKMLETEWHSFDAKRSDGRIGVKEGGGDEMNEGFKLGSLIECFLGFLRISFSRLVFGGWKP